MQLYAFDREMSHLFKKGYPLPDPTTIKIVLSKRPISKYTQKEDHSLPNQEIHDVVVTTQISDLQITQYTPRRHCDTPVLKKIEIFGIGKLTNRDSSHIYLYVSVVF